MKKYSRKEVINEILKLYGGLFAILILVIALIFSYSDAKVSKETIAYTEYYETKCFVSQKINEKGKHETLFILQENIENYDSETIISTNESYYINLDVGDICKIRIKCDKYLFGGYEFSVDSVLESKHFY